MSTKGSKKGGSRPTTPTQTQTFGVDALSAPKTLTTGFSGTNKKMIKVFIQALPTKWTWNYIDPTSKAGTLIELGEYLDAAHPKKSDFRVDLQQDAAAAGGWNIALQVVNSTIATLWLPNGLNNCRKWIIEQLLDILNQPDNIKGGRRYDKA
ncbi:hypothetical protein OC846_000212 [Tilletia horrida]|uniref:Uncharacterized protein n=1 Tax=Tilletia horrida TaxID=155126 RepID=A0AAN6JXA2_9BASI|nr:hypothetical protein OC846_000212 [Tilletia horrida]